MSTKFTYSILQYKHSLAVGESLNVGILFLFPEENKIHFVPGNTQRVKCVYPNFDSNIYTLISKGITSKLHEKHTEQGLFPKYANHSFKDFINVLIPENSSSLQFSETITAVNHFGTPKKAIDEFSKILLPNCEIKKDKDQHDERYIIRKVTDYMVKKYSHVENRISKNKVINVKGLELTFDIAWKNGVTHLVKPISFDLKEGKDIQNKSVTNFGYLDLLKDYAKTNNFVFDLLVTKPKDSALSKSYDKALEILDRAPATKTIYQEDEFKHYSENIAETLKSKDY